MLMLRISLLQALQVARSARQQCCQSVAAPRSTLAGPFQTHTPQRQLYPPPPGLPEVRPVAAALADQSLPQPTATPTPP
jgi:hypothetical protein